MEPGPDHHRILPPGLVEGVLDHLVGDGVGEEHQQIGVAQAVFQGAPHLGDDFGGALVGPAQVLVLADHTLVAAEDHDAHRDSFLFFGSFLLILWDWQAPRQGARRQTSFK